MLSLTSCDESGSQCTSYGEPVTTQRCRMGVGVVLVLALQQGSDGAPDQLVPTATHPVTPPASIAVEPSRQFVFLSVVSDRPGFGWLGQVSSPALLAGP